MIILGVYVWKRRQLYGAMFFFILIVVLELWSAAYLSELLSTSPQTKLTFENICYSLLPTIPIIYFFFIAAFTNKNLSQIKVLTGLLLVEPVLNLLMIWNPTLQPLYRESWKVITYGMNFPGYLISRFGSWFWFAVTYHYIFLIIDLVLLLIAYKNAPLMAKFRYRNLLVGLFLPWITSLLTVIHWITVYRDSILILSLAISIFIIAWGMLQARIFNILPVAQKTILDQVGDAVIVVDSSGKIINFNQAARKYTNRNIDQILNQYFLTIFPQFTTLQFDDSLNQTTSFTATVPISGKHYDFDIKICPLFIKRTIVSGWMVIFHDITQLKQEERRLIATEKKVETSLKELQIQSRELQIMRDTEMTLNLASSVRETLLPIFKTIKSLTPFEQIWVCLLNPLSKSVHHEVFFNDKSEFSPLHFSGELSTQISCLNDLLDGSLRKPQKYALDENNRFFEQVKGKSFYAFPLMTGNKAIGLLNVALSENQFLSLRLINQIEILCTSVAITLDRVRLLKSEYTQRRLAEALRNINAKLTASLKLNDVLDLLLDQIPRLVPMNAGCVMIVEGGNARVTRMRGFNVLGKETEAAISQLVFPIETTENLKKVFYERSPQIIADTTQEPNWLDTEGGYAFPGWIGCPVIIENEVKLIFSLNKKEKDFYTTEHMETISAFCDDVALTVQNAMLFEAGNKRILELESLQTTMQEISSELDTQQLLEAIIHRALELLESNTGVLALYDKESLTYKVAVGVAEGEKLDGVILPADQGILSLVSQTRKPYTIPDYSTWSQAVPEYAKVFPHAILEVPLLAGDDLVGNLIIGDSNQQHTYDENDIRLLMLFAQQATVALKNAQLLADARQRAEEAETLRSASSIVASTLQQKQAMQLILEQLSKVVPYDSAAILLMKEDTLEIVEGIGFTQDIPVNGLRIKMDQSQPGPLVFRKKKPMVINNMEKEYPEFSDYNHLPIHSWIGVPLTVKDQIIGILSLDSLEVNRYTEDHARLASAFADQVAVALENTRLYEEAVKSARQFASLYSLSQSISSNLQPQYVFHAIYQATRELMPCDVFVISLFDEEKSLINDAYVIDNGIIQKSESRPFGVGIFSQAIKENKTLMFNNFSEKIAKKTKAVLIGSENDSTLVRSILVVPLKIGKKIKGVLSAQSYDENRYTEANKEALEMLASHSAIALENARLFNEIREMAMTDSLTHIYNRRKFYELAEAEFSRAMRYKHPLSVIMMDIDKFKHINDTYGHSAGDHILEKIAEICSSSMRSIDILARYGGEEFVAMLPETTVSEAQLMAERLRLLIARSPIKYGETVIHATLSFGVVELEEDCKNIEDLMERSDQAMYASKNSGRNRVSVWNPRMRPSILKKEDTFHI